MEDRIRFGEEVGRTWLTCEYGERTIEYAFPPVEGDYQHCFEELRWEEGLRPAEGLEIPLLVLGAFRMPNLLYWNEVRKKITNEYLRNPRRIFWVPEQDGEGRKNELTGAFVERESQRPLISIYQDANQIEVPKNIDGWKEENGIYYNEDLIFVPVGKYKLGEHTQDSFAKDGLAIALLGKDGAELFAEIAHNHGRRPYISGEDVKKRREPFVDVSAVSDYGNNDLLALATTSFGCASHWPHNKEGYAFGVRKERE
jgi:hypothetical protein